MRSRQGAPGGKIFSKDLAARLGYLSVKIPQPASVDLKRFAVEQFFHNYWRSDLSCLMTADHIEHGFNVIGDAMERQGLGELVSLIDHIFIFALCDIIVNDGKQRGGLFLDRQAHFSTFPEAFISALHEFDETNVDQNAEISEYLMSP